MKVYILKMTGGAIVGVLSDKKKADKLASWRNDNLDEIEICEVESWDIDDCDFMHILK